MSDDQIKALILNYLRRRKRWGASYYPRQKLVKYLGMDVLGDGKEVSRGLDELIKDRWIRTLKKGDTVSLNTRCISEISKHIEVHLIP